MSSSYLEKWKTDLVVEKFAVLGTKCNPKGSGMPRVRPLVS